jgi:glucose-6-phosphate dehydrogenase assembly protein OpcA
MNAAGTLVPLHDVEKEISRQLAALLGDSQGRVHRARMSNLVIHCGGPSDVELVSSQLPSIEAVHPARVLLLVCEPSAEDSLEARVDVSSVSVERQEVCCERVVLQARGPAVDRLPFAVRSLLIGDLPTNLWWFTNQPPPLAGALGYELAEQAQQILYDSRGWLEPARAVAATASWLKQVERGMADRRWRVASDLNWRRLKYWRRLISQSLEPATAPGALASITEISIEHGPHAVIQAWELISWLAARLGWKVETGKVEPAVEISWRFHSTGCPVRVRVRRLPEGPPQVLRVRIGCAIDEKPALLTMALETEQRLSVSLGEGMSVARTINIPVQSPADLVGKQFSDRAPDRVFRESMEVAQVLAESVLD